MKEEEIYKWTLETFTEEHQVIVMIEEMSEFTKELTKWLRQKVNYEHLFEEMADVQIVLDQMILIMGPKGFEAAKETKLGRLEERLESNNMEALK